MKINNKGLSLIELIVVLAIMSVLTAAVGVSISLISRQRVSSAAKETKQEIQLAQTYAKSKGFSKISIKGQSDDMAPLTENAYIYIYVADSESDLSIPGAFRYGDGPLTIYKKRIEITVNYNNDTVSVPINDSNLSWADICFDRRLGGFVTSNYSKNGSAVGSGIPSSIVFTNGDRTVTLRLAQYTGTVTIE